MKNILLLSVLLAGIFLGGYIWAVRTTGSISEIAFSAQTGIMTAEKSLTEAFRANVRTRTPEEEREEIRAVLLREAGPQLSPAEAEKLTGLLQKNEVQDGIYTIWKKNKTWEIGSITLALLLWIGYAYAYGWQIMAQFSKWLPINTRSFVTFGSISGLMTLVNGFVPGSLVYFESFVLAFASVAVDRYNRRYGASPENRTFGKFAQSIPLPVTWYDKHGMPLVWNIHMENETGYTHDEIKQYYEKNGDIMTLLYKGKNRQAADQYMKSATKPWEGYENTILTMIIKSWEEKTFHWTIFPDGNGGVMCIAKI